MLFNTKIKQAKMLLPLGLVLFVLLLQINPSLSLRTGAPSLACLNLRPFHGMHRCKPASSSQFFITQTSYSYAPGQNVTVNITTHSNERYFRGFIIQAYDPVSGAQVGHFLSSDDSRPIDSCSASTHRNNLNKHHVSLTWIPPAFSTGGGLFGQSSGGNQWLPGMPGIHFNVNNQKRQLPPDSHAQVDSAPATAIATAPAPVQPAEPVSTSPAEAPAPATPETPAQTSPSSPAAASSSLHKVKFRATIVVTYEEFYCGFESSDQKFERFDYAAKSTK